MVSGKSQKNNKMRSFYLLILLTVKLSSVFAQIKVDSVFVSTSSTSYLVFKDDIDLVDIGNTAQYVSSIDGKTVFIKAKVQSAAPTTFLVKCGDDYFQGVLCYKETLPRNFYDFRNIEVKTVTTTTTTAQIKQDNNALPAIDTLRLELKDLMNAFKSQATNRYKSYGVMDNQLYWALTDARHSAKYSFIKMKVSNYSNVNYLVDQVTFEVYENKTLLRNDIQIKLEDVPREIRSKEDGYLYFILPLISIPENCELKITLRERGGLRTVVYFAPAKVINTAQTF